MQTLVCCRVSNVSVVDSGVCSASQVDAVRVQSYSSLLFLCGLISHISSSSPHKVRRVLGQVCGSQEQGCFAGILVFLPQGLPVAFACFLTRCLTREPWALPLAGSTAKYKQRREHLESDIMFTKQNRQVLTVVCEKVLRLSIPWS